MKPSLLLVGTVVALIAVSGCQSAQQHAADVEAANAETNRLTVGTVQREIRVGMSGGEVASVLGSPKIATRCWPRQKASWLCGRSNRERSTRRTAR